MLSAGEEPDLGKIFAPFANARAILIAVSGGPDSMALLAMAARWARRARRPRIEAATVDHQLRPQSRDEAQLVAHFAEKLGVPHHTLVWSGEKPKTRLQERAREARYALLEACAKEIGADVLLTAHHADDQAETVLFRLLRGSGIAGLAGMAAVTHRGNLIHGRPLLELPKTALVDMCAREAIDFVRDPSNEDPRFARTALRRLAPLLAAEGLGAPEFARLAARAARLDAALDYLIGKALAGMVRAPDQTTADLSELREAPREIFTRLLAAEISRLTGAKPRLDRAEALGERIARALHRRESLHATLGGALVSVDDDGLFSLAPEGPRKRGYVHASGTFSRAGGEIGPVRLGKPGRES
jgi:tRNA(Ile)-lysidine synthase